MYQKDINEIFKKQNERQFNDYILYCKQVRDNLIIGRDKGYLYFIDIDSLEIADKIDYLVDTSYFSQMTMISKNLLIIASNELNKTYALVIIENKEIIDYETEEERNKDLKSPKEVLL